MELMTADEKYYRRSLAIDLRRKHWPLKKIAWAFLLPTWEVMEIIRDGETSEEKRNIAFIQE